MGSEKCPHPYLSEHADFNIKAYYVETGACKMLILKWVGFPLKLCHAVLAQGSSSEVTQSGSDSRLFTTSSVTLSSSPRLQMTIIIVPTL